jgi:hypothetical protein
MKSTGQTDLKLCFRHCPRQNASGSIQPFLMCVLLLPNSIPFLTSVYLLRAHELLERVQHEITVCQSGNETPRAKFYTKQVYMISKHCWL